MNRPYLEVHIPISPNENFFNMVHYLIESFRQYGGNLYKRTKFVVTVGGDEPYKDLNKELIWASDYWIEWKWLEKNTFKKYSYFATALERFRYSFESEMVLMLDADVMITGMLDDIIEQANKYQTFMGMPAEYQPFWGKIQKISPKEWWEKILINAGFVSNLEKIPPYCNLGFLLAPSEIMKKIGSTIYHELEKINQIVDVPTKCQLAVALAIRRNQIHYKEINMKYNFLCAHPFPLRYNNITKEKLDDVVVWHYAGGRGEIKKHIDLLNPNMVEKFLLKKDLNHVSCHFQKKLEPVHKEIAKKNSSKPQKKV